MRRRRCEGGGTAAAVHGWVSGCARARHGPSGAWPCDAERAVLWRCWRQAQARVVSQVESQRMLREGRAVCRRLRDHPYGTARCLDARWPDAWPSQPLCTALRGGGVHTRGPLRVCAAVNRTRRVDTHMLPVAPNRCEHLQTARAHGGAASNRPFTADPACQRLPKNPWRSSLHVALEHANNVTPCKEHTVIARARSRSGGIRRPRTRRAKREPPRRAEARTPRATATGQHEAERIARAGRVQAHVGIPGRPAEERHELCRGRGGELAAANRRREQNCAADREPRIIHAARWCRTATASPRDHARRRTGAKHAPAHQWGRFARHPAARHRARCLLRRARRPRGRAQGPQARGLCVLAAATLSCMR